MGNIGNGAKKAFMMIFQIFAYIDILTVFLVPEAIWSVCKSGIVPVLLFSVSLSRAFFLNIL